MWTPVSCSLESAEAWDYLADNVAEIESTPADLPAGLAGFEYFVLPDGILPSSHSFGGYDAIDPETGELQVSLMISEAVSPSVRGLLVGHMIMHKMAPDDLGPNLCREFDKEIQAALEDLEPSLIRYYYEEALAMYEQCQDHIQPFRRHYIYRVLDSRYNLAVRNAQSKGRLARQADDARERLKEAGLIIPDGDLALRAKDRKGENVRISLHTERRTVHTCRCCSNPIPKNTPRFTTSTEVKIDGYDHHHYHPGCFTHVELGIFKDFKQIPHEEALPKR